MGARKGEIDLVHQQGFLPSVKNETPSTSYHDKHGRVGGGVRNSRMRRNNEMMNSHSAVNRTGVVVKAQEKH